MDECIFCKIGEKPELESDKHILDTANFFVIAGRGQFCEGYQIICARKHRCNFGELTNHEYDEVCIIKKKLEEKIRRIYNCSPVFFEHGDLDLYHRGGSSISHAHLHVVPLEVNYIPDYLLKIGGKVFEDDVSARCYLKHHKPYFYFQNSAGEICIVNSSILPCQFGRQLLVNELALNVDWDWRKATDFKRMIETIKLFRGV